MAFILSSAKLGKLAATKSMILMLMIASFSCAVLAVFLSLLVGISLVIGIPGIVVGVFFAFRYAMYDKTKAREEEHKRTKKRHKH
jgi:Flp pilus assembly protein TadB